MVWSRVNKIGHETYLFKEKLLPENLLIKVIAQNALIGNWELANCRLKWENFKIQDRKWCGAMVRRLIWCTPQDAQGSFLVELFWDPGGNDDDDDGVEKVPVKPYGKRETVRQTLSVCSSMKTRTMLVLRDPAMDRPQELHVWRRIRWPSRHSAANSYQEELCSWGDLWLGLNYRIIYPLASSGGFAGQNIFLQTR